MVFFIFIQIFKFKRRFCKQYCFVESDLGLYHLPMSHRKDAWFIWVEQVDPYLLVLLNISQV